MARSASMADTVPNCWKCTEKSLCIEYKAFKWCLHLGRCLKGLYKNRKTWLLGMVLQLSPFKWNGAELQGCTQPVDKNGIVSGGKRAMISNVIKLFFYVKKRQKQKFSNTDTKFSNQ